MCGIAGIIGLKDEDSLAEMLKAISHRGPDDSGSFHTNECSLGMNRLSILDVSSAGHQPMMSEDARYVIVYNGEIYNYQQVRENLRSLGFVFHSNTDTEVLLKGYIAYGEKVLNIIRGMFAFVIWDNEHKTAFGARDHLGIKPLLYHIENNVFTFCSEIKGILKQPRISHRVSMEGMQLYLSYGYIGAPYTIIDNVAALKPGTKFTWKQGQFTTNTYWDVPSSSVTSLSYLEACKQLKEMVVAKVDEQLVSDVPLGLFLSGGLDSTVVLAAMRIAGKENIQSFSLGFKNMKNSEEHEAKAAAKYYNTKHHELIIDGLTAQSAFHNFIQAIDQPNIDGLNVFLISEFTRKHVTVALSGLGPDELFLGYKWQRSSNPPKWVTTNYLQSLLPHLNKIWPKRYLSVLSYLQHVSDPIVFYTYLNRYLSDEALESVMNGNYKSKFNTDWIKQFDNPNEQNRYNRISRLDMKLFMGARVLNASDAVSMFHSLEVRFPLIDSEIVEFSSTLPNSYKMFNTKHVYPWTKYEGNASYEKSGVKRILYDAFKSELENGFGSRSKKGFKFPIDHWMEKEFTELWNEINIPIGLKKNWQSLVLLSWLKKYNLELPF